MSKVTPADILANLHGKIDEYDRAIERFEGRRSLLETARLLAPERELAALDENLRANAVRLQAVQESRKAAEEEIRMRQAGT